MAREVRGGQQTGLSRADPGPMGLSDGRLAVHFIEPRKPAQNGFAKGFTSTLRAQSLNEYSFTSIYDARERVGKWRQIYNEQERGGDCPLLPVPPHRAAGAAR